MKELWINNQLIDLYVSEPIALTKQANDIRELKNRNADYSNRFKIPATGNNLRITGFVNRASSDSINPYTKLPCRLLENGTEVISNGVAIIDGYSRGSIEITCYSGIFDFFSQLGEKSIRDLRLTDADHIADLTGVQAGFSSDYYCYPLINWGATDTNNNIVDIRHQMPAVKLSYIVDKIFEGIGYNKGGEVFELDSYKAMWIPVIEDAPPYPNDALAAFSMKAYLEQDFVYNGIPFKKASFTDFNTGDAFESTAGWYSFYSGYWRYSPQLAINARIQLTLYAANPTGTYLIRVLKNRTYTIAQYVNSSGAGFEKIEIDERIILRPGDHVEIEARSFGGAVTIYRTGDTHGESGSYSTFSITAENGYSLNSFMSMKNLVPDIKQKDVIKFLQNKYALIPQVDHLTRTVNFIQFKAFSGKKDIPPRTKYIKAPFGSKKIKVTLPAHTVDWSDKLYMSTDLADSNNPSIALRSNYSQKNNMKWIQDDDRAEVGDGAFYIDDQVLPGEQDLFTMPFAASIPEVIKGNLGVNIKGWTSPDSGEQPFEIDVTYNNGDKVLYNGMVWEATDGPHFGSIPDLIPGHWRIYYEKSETVQPRIVMLRDFESKLSPPVPLDYTDGTNTVQVDNAKIAYFVDPVQAYDLSLKRGIDDHYQDIVNVLTKTKIITCKFKLSENEFKNINFFRPVYVDHFGEYFYINKVVNYISGRLTTVELVRL